MKTIVLAAIAVLSGCAATDSQKSDAADTAYGVDQADCVRTASTRAQADACRAAKRGIWDAGTDGGAK